MLKNPSSPPPSSSSSTSWFLSTSCQKVNKTIKNFKMKLSLHIWLLYANTHTHTLTHIPHHSEWIQWTSSPSLSPPPLFSKDYLVIELWTTAAATAAEEFASGGGGGGFHCGRHRHIKSVMWDCWQLLATGQTDTKLCTLIWLERKFKLLNYIEVSAETERVCQRIRTLLLG